MQVGMYQASQGMRAMWEAQQNLASNLARQSVPGHRRLITAIGVSPSDGGRGARSSGAPSSSLIVSSSPDFTQGMLQPSDDPLHVAIMGQSFFSVRETDGSTSYTRNGQFARVADGRVLTHDGAEVLLEGGQPLRIPDQAKPSIQIDGTVSAGGQDLGRLALASFSNPATELTEASYGRFQAVKGAAHPAGAVSGDQVVQGQLEQSNAQPMEEMVTMMQVMRTYEANQKMLAAHDDATGRLIQTVGAEL